MRKALTAVAWLFAVVSAVWAALRWTGWDAWFPAVQVLAFTPYALVCAAVGVPIVMKWHRGPAVIAGLSAALLALCVLPRGYADREPLPAGPQLRVASANLLVGGADAVDPGGPSAVP